MRTSEPVQRPLLNRTLQRVRRLWRDLGNGGEPQTPAGPALKTEDEAALKRLMQASVSEHVSEVSARARAAELGYSYLGLDPEGRRRYLQILTETLDIDDDRVTEAAGAYLEAPDGSTRYRLQQAVVPPRVRFVKMLNSLPEGFKFLVDLRKDLLRFLPESPELEPLDRDLRGLFDLWFDVSLLSFERITWDSPASLLEKLIAYEAVHKVRSWPELKSRLEDDRRCYAFFHPKMAEEPLIFVQVALTHDTPDNVQHLLNQFASEELERATTAVFYSISNTQQGLSGIGFGPFLLKQVIDDLTKELPRLKTFVTLSPIPGFVRWLERSSAEGADAGKAAPLVAAFQEALRGVGMEGGITALLEHPDWWRQEELTHVLREPLLALCAHYLVRERRPGGKPLDPVARFHLNNGAQIERINFLADASPEGIKQSLGMMVNYEYKLNRIEPNHEKFVQAGEVVAAPRVKRLLRA